MYYIAYYITWSADYENNVLLKTKGLSALLFTINVVGALQHLGGFFEVDKHACQC